MTEAAVWRHAAYDLVVAVASGALDDVERIAAVLGSFVRP
jgi:hypothetical protein